MFENIKREQSLYDWKALEGLKKEDPDKYEQYQEELQELKEVTENMRKSNESDLACRQKELIMHIRSFRADEVVWLAYKNTSDSFSGYVLIDLETGELYSFSQFGNIYHSKPNTVVLFILDKIWLNNNPWQVEDILPEEDWKRLKEKYGDKADFLDREQLESIGWDLDTALMDYLRYCLQG